MKPTNKNKDSLLIPCVITFYDGETLETNLAYLDTQLEIQSNQTGYILEKYVWFDDLVYCYPESFKEEHVWEALDDSVIKIQFEMDGKTICYEREFIGSGVPKLETTTIDKALESSVKALMKVLELVLETGDLKTSSEQYVNDDLDYVTVNYLNLKPEGESQERLKTKVGIGAIEALELLTHRINNTLYE